MKTIWKYNLDVKDEQVIIVPRCGIPLSVQVQSGILTIWVAINDRIDKVSQLIKICGTGHSLDNMEAYKYVSTVQIDSFVWHVFWHRHNFVLDK